MKVTGAGFEKAVIGVGIAAALAVVAYIGYKAYTTGASIANAASDLSNNIAGALVPDANAATQTQFQKEMAALKAEGSPPVGSALYDSIVAEYNPAQVVTGG